MPAELTSLFASIFAAGVIIAILVIIIVACVFIVFNVFTLMLGAKFAGIDNRGFGKAFVSALVINFFWGFLVYLLSFFENPYFGLMAILLVPCIIIKIIYGCSLWQAIIAYIVSLIAYMLFAVLIVLTGFVIVKGVVDSKKSQSIESTTKIKSEKTNVASYNESSLPAKEPIKITSNALPEVAPQKTIVVTPPPKKKLPAKTPMVKTQSSKNEKAKKAKSAKPESKKKVSSN